jgi:hypothetical protein
MFQTLHPSWSDLSAVAHCANPPGASFRSQGSADFGSGDGNSTLCQVAPGQWKKVPYGNGPLYMALVIAWGALLVALHRTSIVIRGMQSLPKFLLLAILIWGTPMALWGLHTNFIEGTLTPDWAVHVVIYVELIGGVAGVVAWYTVVRPLQGRRKIRR